MEKETWLSEFLETDKDWREAVLRKTRVGVAELGRLTSLILIDFLSEREDEDISTIFRRVRENLEPKIRADHSLVVLDRVFALLETGEGVLRDRDMSAALIMSMKSKDRVEAQTRMVTPMEEFTFTTIKKLCDQIIFLEEMVKLVLGQRVAYETMSGNFEQCENCLQLLDEEVSSRVEQISFFKEGSETGDDEDDGGDELLEVMKEKAEELWSEFELYHKD